MKCVWLETSDKSDIQLNLTEFLDSSSLPSACIEGDTLSMKALINQTNFSQSPT